MAESALKAIIIKAMESWVIETLDPENNYATGEVNADHVVAYIDEEVDLKVLADYVLAALAASPDVVQAFLEA